MKKSFFTILISVLCISCHANKIKTPKVKNGMLDLSNWDFKSKQTIALDGEWEFYWKKLYSPNDFNDRLLKSTITGMINVPGYWNINGVKGKKFSGFGYATYRLKIKTDSVPKKLGLKIPSALSSYKLFVNDELVATNGTVANNPNDMRPRLMPAIKILDKTSGDIILTFQVSNFFHYKGGIFESFEIGSEEQIMQNHNYSVVLDLFLIGAFLILWIYHLWIFFFRKTELAFLWFGLLCISMILRVLTTSQMFLYVFFPEFPNFIGLKLEYISVYAFTFPCLCSFIYYIFPKDFSKSVLKVIYLLAIGEILFISFSPAKIFTSWLLVFNLTSFIIGLYFVYILIKAFRAKRPYAGLSFSGTMIMFVFMINDVLHAMQLINTFYMVPLGIFLFLLLQAYILANLINQSFIALELSSKKIGEVNFELQEKIQALEVSEVKFKSIVNKTSDLIVLSELDGTLSYVSPSSKKMLGYEPEEIIGINGFDLIHPDDVPDVRGRLNQTLTNNNVTKSNRIEYRLKKKDGNYIYIEVRISLVYENDKVKTLILILHDITDRKLIEKERFEYEQMLEAKVKERTHELQDRTRELESEKKKADDLLLNILPEETALELKMHGAAKARTYGLVSVIFTDFINFTSISEKTVPELLVAELDHCFSEFDKIVQRHGVEKIKTVGDAYLCAAGLPSPTYTHARDAVNAAMEMCNFILQRKKEKEANGEIPFEVRIGIHSGPVVAGIVGLKKFAYDIWGDTVNVASRMEQNCDGGRVNISGTTYELVKNEFKCEYRGKIQAKNKGEIDMYFVN